MVANAPGGLKLRSQTTIPPGLSTFMWAVGAEKVC